MEVRRPQNAKSVCIKRRHGAMSAGDVWKKNFAWKAVALLSVVADEEENEEEERFPLVAAALSKKDAGVALLVREVGVALLCFYSERRDMCICCFYCFARGSREGNTKFPEKGTGMRSHIIPLQHIFSSSSHLLSSHSSRAPCQQ